MIDDRKLFMQAVLDGQLSAEYITDKELMSVHLKLWEKMLEEYLPQSAVLLH
jgi:hypothetical protein